MLEIETSNTYTTFKYLCEKTIKLDEENQDLIKYEEHMQSRLQASAGVHITKTFNDKHILINNADNNVDVYLLPSNEVFVVIDI